MTSAILFGSFFTLLAIGVPIGIALGTASLVAIAWIPFLNFDLYALGLISGIDSFTLIAGGRVPRGVGCRPPVPGSVEQGAASVGPRVPPAGAGLRLLLRRLDLALRSSSSWW